MATDSSLDDIVAETQRIVGACISHPPMKPALLRRPPFRFLHDTICAICREGNVLAGVLTPDELDSKHVREALGKAGKQQFFAKVIAWASQLTNTAIPAIPEEICAGIQPERTNFFLQQVVAAAKLQRQLHTDKRPSTPDVGRPSVPAAIQLPARPMSSRQRRLNQASQRPQTAYARLSSDHITVHNQRRLSQLLGLATSSLPDSAATASTSAEGDEGSIQANTAALQRLGLTPRDSAADVESSSASAAVKSTEAVPLPPTQTPPSPAQSSPTEQQKHGPTRRPPPRQPAPGSARSGAASVLRPATAGPLGRGGTWSGDRMRQSLYGASSPTSTLRFDFDSVRTRASKSLEDNVKDVMAVRLHLRLPLAPPP